MCGISGIFGKSWQDDQLTKMVLAQKHRGPNFSGIYINKEKQIGLGHNRLSILDLSASANQPMFSEDKRYSVVFNGEIYNFIEIRKELQKEYAFHTESDTEVLLNAWQKWGKDCLRHFIGMFSFAIWDEKEQKIFAARDRFGIKPFYYSLHKNNFYFASEIKALWASGINKKPYEPIWAAYLSKAVYSGDGFTFWEDIFELRGGHCLEYDGEKLTISKWYDFEKNISSTKVFTDEAELEENYTQLLIDAVALRFRADVPIGFNLSGGLDSSVLLAMVNHLYPNQNYIKAFSFYTGNKKYDELPWVYNMIKNTANPLTPCLLRPEDVRRRVSKMCKAQDEPFGGIPTIAYSRVFEEACKDVVVLLDGQGMDEAWAGYDYYTNHHHFTVQGTQTSPARPETLKPHFLQSAACTNFKGPFDDPLKNLQYRDLFLTKIPRALRFNDSVSMMYSTELREPFLDYRLVEMAFAQNRSMKIRDHQSKWLLRRIASKYLSPEISFAPKRPLQTPQREWLAGELKPLVDLSLTKLVDHPWFNADALRKEWKGYKAGARDNSFFVWQWINTAFLLPN